MNRSFTNYTHICRITELEGQLSHAETTIKNLHNEFNNR